MSTELDLHDIHQSHQPDPTFVAELERRLAAILAGESPGGDPPVDVEAAIVAPPVAPRRSVWSVVLGVAAATALVGTLGVVVWRLEDPAEFASTEQDPLPTEVTGTVALPTPTAPTSSVAPPPTVPVIVDPWLGTWLSTDTDGSNQTMEVTPVGTHDYEIVIHDDATIACSGPPATIIGTGQLTNDETLVIPQAELTCDDGAVPVIGLPPQPDLANFTFVLDPETDQLVDPAGVVWWREGAAGAVATSVTVAPADESTGVTGMPTAAQTSLIVELLDSVNSMAADNDAEVRLPDVFTEDAVISPANDWDLRPVTDTAVLGTWVQHLRTWGFEGDLTTQNCFTEEGTVICPVRGRWETVLAEADEYWYVEFVDGRIRSLSIQTSGTRFDEAGMPMSLADLDRWEHWLLETDPSTAARLIPDDGTSQPFPLVPRYDPALADEITASIQTYLDQRPPGDQITVTDDMIQLGDGLVGLIGNMDRADGRTYVIAGHYRSEGDLLRAPDEAVLAAFDDTGNELWRTELTGGPVSVVAVEGSLWVRNGGGGTITQFGAADGRLLGQITTGQIPNGQVTNGYLADMVAASGSLWVQVIDGSGTPIQLLRVDSNQSMTTIELPRGDAPSDESWPQGLAAGPDAIWVPLGEVGVARIDTDTLEVTVLSADEVGHVVTQAAVDGDVVYVGSNSQVTSIVDGEVVATTSLGEFWHMGHVEGVFGAMGSSDTLTVLQPTDPMIVEVRPVNDGGGAGEVDGETWAEIGWNYSLHRVEFQDDPGGDGG